MNYRSIMISVIGYCILSCTAGCGTNGFEGKNQKTGLEKGALIDKSDDSLDKDLVGPGSVEGGTAELEIPTQAEKNALVKCHKSWGEDPPSDFGKVRKIKASISIGSSGVTLLDKAKTESPSLTIVHTSVNIGGSPIWELGNPNGWYCMMITVNVGTKLTVRIDENAKLADSKLEVNVGSKVDGSTSSIGINVGSEVTVEKL